ncbi:acetoacetate decarboxylase [Amycolatopsis carbonis]|uniref:Acetoacetate decarboxylase n=1 Tax=Amycolatopsis carbonis TaxID=715471 RepID=A0A9Y2IFX2_9PSEU|nr:acetoacetate decarboxylase [Amycolatopsis sp. 2-15]WIX79327.1 acetoacetate decarboxylase [Amycolatopsis sp. 2-15]
MREDEVLAQLTTPLSAPAFPRGPYRFTDREYLNITYRTDPAALRALVPEPLVVDEPLVRFEVMRMPDATGLGDYTESGQVAMVRHGDEAGEFTLGMYVDSLPAIASGREVAAYPKKLGKPRLYTDSDTLVGSLDYGSIQVALATMGYKHRTLDEAEARAELTAPTFMLKIVPGYDGRPRICELARSQISDVTIKGAWTGPARLHLVAHALAPLADLPVLEIVSASHLLTDLTLGRLAVVHDYLA